VSAASSSAAGSSAPPAAVTSPPPGSLIELRIKDFAIIDELSLSLEPGLNALTGETGAGKSILIDALGAVLGERTGPNVVRAGAQRALVEATFVRPVDLPDELELDGEDDVIILSREIGSNGRGGARLNGRTVPVSLLQVAGRALVDVHGQSDHQSLFRPVGHMRLLDRFGGLEGQRQQVAAAVQQLRQVGQQLEALRGAARDRARQQDLLRFQADEIEAAQLTPGEDEDLAHRRLLLASAEKIREAVSEALARLNDDGQAMDAVQAAAKQLSDAIRLDPALEQPAQELELALTGLQDAGRSLARYLDAVEADPAELQRIDDRLELIRGLKRKYGDSLDEVLAFGRDAALQLAEIEGADARIEELDVQAQRLLEEANVLAAALSEARQDAAERLASQVGVELAELSMKGAQFAASVRRREGPDALQPGGLDEVEFLLSANRGEPLRPLAQVASGGEASRVMLALKSVFSAADQTPVLVFDEIEVGVGARSGHVIGDKLRHLAAGHQVLCITHLAPVAARANAHFKVTKGTDGERTGTLVLRIEGEARVREMAEMLAGHPISEAAIESARQLLAAC